MFFVSRSSFTDGSSSTRPKQRGQFTRRNNSHSHSFVEYWNPSDCLNWKRKEAIAGGHNAHPGNNCECWSVFDACVHLKRWRLSKKLILSVMAEGREWIPLLMRREKINVIEAMCDTNWVGKFQAYELSCEERSNFVLVSLSPHEDSECDERMLSNIRNNPRVPERQNCCLSPRVPSRRRRQENISNPLRHWMASSSCIVTNFHFFHRDPCHPSLSIREMGLFSVFLHGLKFPCFLEGWAFGVY